MSKVVIGLGFGDEGKGQTTSWLSSLNPKAVVVRHSGGSQAGHNVVTPAGTHIFASFGSGTLNGNRTHLAHTCLVNPIHLMREYDLLVRCGFMPEITIDSRCPIVTPLDIECNLGDDDNMQHGSCGCGINATLRREEDHYSLTAGDLLVSGLVWTKSRSMVQNYYECTMGTDTNMVEFIEACERIVEIADIIPDWDTASSVDMDDIIYEGSQGLLLDKDIGIFPHVTPCNVGLKSEGIMADFTYDVYYVTRAYGTRHGNGPSMFPSSDCPAIESPYETNHTNEHQGEFRLGMLNVDMLKYGLSKDDTSMAFRKNLVVTCLEHMMRWEYWYRGEVCTFSTKEVFCARLAKDLGMDVVFMMENHKVTHLGGASNV